MSAIYGRFGWLRGDGGGGSEPGRLETATSARERLDLVLITNNTLVPIAAVAPQARVLVPSAKLSVNAFVGFMSQNGEPMASASYQADQTWSAFAQVLDPLTKKFYEPREAIVAAGTRLPDGYELDTMADAIRIACSLEDFTAEDTYGRWFAVAEWEITDPCSPEEARAILRQCRIESLTGVLTQLARAPGF